MTTAWNMRVASEPMLVLDGIGRSLFIKWPEGAHCDTCGISTETGYAGPAERQDMVKVPDPALKFRCRECARASLGLQPNELSGHMCSFCVSDDLHVDRVYVQAPSSELDALGPEGRVELFNTEQGYGDRGWRVTSVEWNGNSWDVQFVRRRDLW